MRFEGNSRVIHPTRLTPSMGTDVSENRLRQNAPADSPQYSFEHWISGECFLQEFVNPARIKSWGIEIGNWLGFAGIPMGTGSSSFVEVQSFVAGKDHVQFNGRVLMPRLSAAFNYRTWQDGSQCLTELTLLSAKDSLLGDVVLHSTFQVAGPASFNGVPLTRPGRYIYSTSPFNRLAFQGAPHLAVSAGLVAPQPVVDLELIPYACPLPDGRIRYHTRGLCTGGRNSRLMVRMRGALSCMEIGPAPLSISRWLYRIERKAPRRLPNFQLCAASRFPRGTGITLRHCMERC